MTIKKDLYSYRNQKGSAYNHFYNNTLSLEGIVL